MLVTQDPNAAFEALKAQQNDGGWTASDVGHMALDIVGLAPVVGEWADGLNAAWYFSEGDVFNGSLSAGAVIPGAGIGVTLGKWFGKGADALRRIDLENPATKELVDVLAAQGVKHIPENIVDIKKTSDGKMIFMEIGNNDVGLTHILERHGNQFASHGIDATEVSEVVMRAVTDGKIVGYQGKGTGRPVYRVENGGRPQEIAITVSDNGFVVGANPADPKKYRKLVE